MDTVAQFLTSVRNASNARHEKVDVPASKVRAGIAKILMDNGYIKNFKVAKDSKQGIMRLYLKYDQEGNPVFSDLNRISRPGRRVYVGFDEIPVVRSGYGMTIVSTSKGIMSGKQAKTDSIGGELLCAIW
ncbi:MAG: 30S ribosomal protein S8 [Bdellovibrionota bacterium]